MSSSLEAGCRQFRTLLERKLGAGPAAPDLSELGWHGHLLGCVACRRLLEEEEALEMLLESLPEPKLPADLTRRLIARLREHRASEQEARELARPGSDDELDRWLELAGEVRVPEGLADRVLVAVARRSPRERDAARVDALLALDAEPTPPEGLSERVIASLMDELARSEPGLRPRGPRLVRGALARAAAVLVATLVLAFLWKTTLRPRTGPDVPAGSELASGVAPRDAAPDPEMLAVLDLLENWDLLAGERALDVEVATFEGLEPADELVLDLLEDGPARDPSPEPVPAEDSNG